MYPNNILHTPVSDVYKCSAYEFIDSVTVNYMQTVYSKLVDSLIQQILKYIFAKLLNEKKLYNFGEIFDNSSLKK